MQKFSHQHTRHQNLWPMAWNSMRGGFQNCSSSEPYAQRQPKPPPRVLAMQESTRPKSVALSQAEGPNIRQLTHMCNRLIVGPAWAKNRRV